MGQSTPNTQTVTNKTEIDPFTQQWRSALFGEAKNIYNQGPNTYFPGSTVTGYSPQTYAGLQMMQNQALKGMPGYDAAQSALQSSVSNTPVGLGTLTSAMRGEYSNPYLDSLGSAGAGLELTPYMQSALSGTTGANPYLSQIATTATNPTTAGAGYLESIVSGENPYLDQMFDKSASKVRDAVNAQFAQAGRYGPNAAYTEALSGSLGDLATSVYGNAYENQQNRAMQAAGQLAGLSQADRAAALSGLGQAAGLAETGFGRQYQTAGAVSGAMDADRAMQYQQALAQAGYGADDIERMLSAAQNASGLQSQGYADALRGIAIMPELYNMGLQPANTLMGVGNAYETLADQYLQDEISRYYYNQQAPWDALNQYANIINGLPDFSGTTSTSTEQTRRNAAMSGLGGAATGAQLGSMFGPWGTALGAVGGGLFGLFG